MAGNERGQPIGIIADTDQEGRRDLGEPFQAEEIQALNLGGAGLVAGAAGGFPDPVSRVVTQLIH
jgi:hypothetical protein